MFGCATINIALVLFHLFAAVFGAPVGRSFRSVHLTVMLVLAVLIHPLFRGSMREPVLQSGGSRNAIRALGFAIDLALIAMVLFVQLWTIWDIDAFHMRFGEKETPDLIIGGIFIAIVLEATRRAVGWAMVIIIGFFYGPRCSSGSSSTPCS